MRAPWASALLCALACAPALAGGCGPSLRRIHLADAYFERCYAGDRDARATDPERRACWRAWLGSWRDGQAIERIDYAEERLLTLDPERAAILALALTGDEGEFGLAMEGAEPLEAGSEGEPVPTPATGTDAPPAPEPTSGGASAEARAGSDAEAPRDASAEETAADAARAEELHRRHRPLAPRTTSPVCAAACEPQWVACTDDCVEGDRACVTACRVSHRTCARGCY